MKNPSKNVVSFRMDQDLESSVQNWLLINKGFKMSNLINLALREFISQPHTLEPVEVSDASDNEAMASAKKMMKKHKDTLDKLK